MNLLEIRLGATVGFRPRRKGLARSAGRIVQVIYSPTARSYDLIVESGGERRRVNGRRARLISGPLFHNPELLWVHPWPFNGRRTSKMQRNVPYIDVPVASRHEFSSALYLPFAREDVRRIEREVLEPLPNKPTWTEWTTAAYRLRGIYCGIAS